MKKNDSEKRLCAPLLEALKIMQRWLERDGADRLMVAAPTLKAFQRQSLPAHLRISVKKRQSERVATKGPRHYRNSSALTLTRWPEDGQESNAVPALLCVLRGHADLHIADYMLHCQPGDIIVFPSGVPQPDSSRPHYQAPHENKSCDLFWMCPGMPGNDCTECWICHSQGTEHLTGSGDEVCWIRNNLLVQQFYCLAEESQDNKERRLAFYLLSCILLLAQREIEQEHMLLPGHQGTNAVDQETSRDPIEQACAYIKSHLNQAITIHQLARQVCLSPTSLTRKFRSQTGKSLTEYVNAIRLQEAASLLQETEWSINMVCRYVGLKPTRMRQLFQQHHGCSPTKFRDTKKAEI